jgi:periplasmic divalent cation tolerance protein
MQVAKDIAHVLIDKKLAGCCNILPEMVSIYCWKEEKQEDHEVVLIAKTTENLTQAVEEAVIATHPYESPCVLVVPVTGGNSVFCNWLRNQVE